MPFHSSCKTSKYSNKVRKRAGRDLDQIAEDLLPEKRAALEAQPVDPDLPGEGQFYCVECSRYFNDAATLEKHRRSKLHKQRVRDLVEPPYSQAEADAAGGMGGRVNYRREASIRDRANEVKMEAEC